MAVKLLKQNDNKTWRPCWYGVFDVDHKRHVINTGVKWQGVPPASGSLRDPGDAVFEAWREKAEAALERHRDEARRKGNATHLVERLIETKTGRRVEHVRIDDLAERWVAGPRSGRLSKQHAEETRSIVKRFAQFMTDRNRKTVFA